MLVSRCGGRARCVGLAIALGVAALIGGCAHSAPAAAPPVAAADLAVTELASSFDASPTTQTAPTTVDEGAAASDPATMSATVGLSEATAALESPPASTVTPAAPPTTVADDDGGDSRAHDALDLIAFPWRRTLPTWTIRFLPARAGLRGLTIVDDRRIEIYERDTDTPATLARTIAHELGHAVDVQLNTPSDREQWRVLRGAGAGVAWWPEKSMSDFDTLAGDFAEAFASWLIGSVSESRVASQPGPREFAVLAALVGTR
jgi:hypothetical protein